MPDLDPEKNPADKTPDPAGPENGDAPGLPQNLTLETIIDSTGELEHLNDLILLSLERAGGFTCTEAYFSTVQPILDLLEVEIRVRCRAGMSRNEMKLIIQDWIDSEIRQLQ